MAVLPMLPPAAQDFKCEVTIPASLAPYMDMIKSIAAPDKTYEQWFSGFLVNEGEKYLKQHMANQIFQQSMKLASVDLDSELNTILGRVPEE